MRKVQRSLTLAPDIADAMDIAAAERGAYVAALVREYVIDGLRRDGYITPPKPTPRTPSK